MLKPFRSNARIHFRRPRVFKRCGRMISMRLASRTNRHAKKTWIHSAEGIREDLGAADFVMFFLPCKRTCGDICFKTNQRSHRRNKQPSFFVSGSVLFFFPGDFSVFSSKKTSWKLFYDSMMLDALFFSPAQLHAANLPSIGVISTFQPNPKV